MNGILWPLDMNTDPTFTQLLNSYFVQSVSLIDGVLPGALRIPHLWRHRYPHQGRLRQPAQQSRPMSFPTKF
jgi:hypothetical protein